MSNKYWKLAFLIFNAMKAINEKPSYNGLVYLHPDMDGKAEYVVMTLDRFQEVAGGCDPGHDDSFAHGHVYE